MNLRHLLLCQPDRRQQILIWLLALIATALIGYLHLLSGLSYEFHLFFGLPIALVSWYISPQRGFVIAVLATILWYLADRELGGPNSDRLALLFNTGVRLLMFTLIVGMLGQLRLVLARESRLAHEDPLTRLANRRAFTEQGEALLALARRENIPLAAIVLDLDHFKEVNDSHGHDTGDKLLQTVASVLRAHLRSSDIAARLGGDEFALLLAGSPPDAVRAFADDLQQRLTQAMQNNHWPVTFSLGIVVRQPPETLATLLKDADQLMYEAKNQGRNRIIMNVDNAAKG